MLPVTSLGLSAAFDLRDSNLCALGGMNQLTELDLSGERVANKISIKGLEALSKLPNLRVLKMEDWESHGRGPTCFEIADALSKLPLLTDLDLNDFEHNRGMVDDVFLKQLRWLPLRRLNVANSTKISDKGLEGLEDMPLTCLNLRCCGRITDSGIQSLMGLPLTSLDLAGLKRITDDSVRVFKDMPLTSLNLCSCRKVTDVGLKYLWKVPLTDLTLYGCESITVQGLLSLRCQGMPLRQLKLNGWLWRNLPISLGDVASMSDDDE